MAFLHARAGIARAGVTHSGWTPPRVQVHVGGVVATAGGTIGWSNFAIQTHADGSPDTCTFIVNGFTPAPGADVRVLFATPNEYLFTGTLLQPSVVAPVPPGPAEVEWSCTATGYQWLMDRYDVVTAQYRNLSVNTIVGRILADFTDGGFRVGYIPSSLGTLSVDFTQERVSAALNRIAKDAGAFWSIGPDRTVSMYTVYPEAAFPPIDDDTEIVLDGYGEDLTQVRTRTMVRGRGSTTTADVPVAATTIPVQDTSPFSVGGGQAIVTQNLLTYTGLTTTVGPGALTGVSGVAYRVASGESISLVVSVTDGAAETALAAVLGGGLSGQATHTVDEQGSFTQAATGRALAENAVFGSSLKDLGFSILDARRMRVGREITVSRTTPVAIADTFRIQQIDIESWAGLTGFVVLNRRVTASKFVRSLTRLLKQLN